MAPEPNTMNDTTHSSATDTSASVSTKKKKEAKPQASMGDTLAFVFECGPRITALFVLGSLGGVLNGLVYPALAYLFSTSFSDISSASSNGIGPVRDLAMTFLVVGAYALVVATIQTWCFELVAYHATQNFRFQWFRALLRQDAAYFDVNDVGGISGQVGPSANKYRRGLGRKFGEGIQFLVTGVGGIAYAFYASWRVAFVVISVVPFVSLSALAVMQLNQTKGSRAAAAYKTAGGVAYTAVSAIKTVLSLNAIQTMMDQYATSTQEAYRQATGILLKQGLANGSMLGTFMLLYAVLTLYGSALLYRDVEDSGCDPSGGVLTNETCEEQGSDVFGAMLGVAFAAQGVSQFGNFSEAFTQARIAAYDALLAMNRKPGSPEVIIYRKPNADSADDLGTTNHSKKSKAASEKEGGEQVIQAILPKYVIDSTSDNGLKPKDVQGALSFSNVRFSYPTRPNETVLKGLTVDIAAGETCAFVGPSGSGKSTVVGLLERFYDPQQGSVSLDGVDLKELNVAHLRGLIGYVGQEPTLFATTIRANIQYGNPNATFEQIQEAARLSNAHDFISSFPEGYDTQVGDKGSQLSGGQKQRIAIARVLVGNPKVLLLDESTSALDMEAEIVCQEALDNIMEQKKITTILIAHRLSTIRNADKINVLVNGEVVESGPHDELMGLKGYYQKLVEKQDGTQEVSGTDSGLSSRNGSTADLQNMEKKEQFQSGSGTPHISFKNVEFAYPSRPGKVVLNGFNLDIERGSSVALCGSSGGGKSTTVGLVERFYDPSAGTVEYQGVDIKSLNVHWYRDQIGYVGQEPTLFNDTIANNIAYGAPGASRADIEDATRQANAHDFITEFDEGYETQVGERGTQLSGGQKQRIAIARALVKKPQLLILDEATSALDNASESIVQAAIDKLMESREHTCIVIAHRLSTIRNADKIAFVSDGVVHEEGTHDRLIEIPNGRYKRLFEASKRNTEITSANLNAVKSKKTVSGDNEEEEQVDWEAKIAEEEAKAFNVKRARQMAAPDANYMLVGSIGAVMAGSVFPLWGLLFSETIDLLFRPVFPCPAEDGSIPGSFATCEDYWQDFADDMQDTSFVVSGYWILVMVGCVVGNVVVFWGFGTASERLSKRVRDSSFSALLRQEVAFFDKRSVGSITSQLQDDAARIQAFSGKPVEAFLIAVSSVVTGLVLSFIFMWPFALLAVGCVPLMGFATSLEMKQYLGEDESEDDVADEGTNTPGGVIVETLLNMRTVSALTLEKARFEDYKKVSENEEPNIVKDAFLGGLISGLSMFIQQWINGLQLWFGGWLLNRFPDDYGFKDFLISNFAVLFGLFGLGAAFQDVSDRKEVEKSAGRILYLLDRQSEIDPLGTEGKKLNSDYVVHSTSHSNNMKVKETDEVSA